MKGRVDHKQQGETKLIALEVTPFEAVPERREVRVALDARAGARGRDRRARPARARLPGRRRRSYLVVETSDGPKTLALGPEYRVRPDADFLAEAKALLGDAASRVARTKTRWGLQEDLKSEFDAAAALEKTHGLVEVDLVGERKNGRCLRS